MSVEYSTEGSSFGEIHVVGTNLLLNSSINQKQLFGVDLQNLTLCVVPANNRDEVEMQFNDPQMKEKKGDFLVQMTLHFPVGEDDDGFTQAELCRQKIEATGLLKSTTGDIIAEFSKEQGNFVTPRGKYGLQLTSSYLHMQGPQYSYKINYSDIDCFFLLPKMDSGRKAFVISLKTSIRQGNQKYTNLVIETHDLEATIPINLSQEDIDDKYEGQLSSEITLPTSSLFGKLFKVLTGHKVFVPKNFISARSKNCVRCSIKANEGLLYPLAKSFIFINKPTVIIKFEDIELIEFQRFEGGSATRNFDMVITLKDSAVSGGDPKEYNFRSIDRTEYSSLYEYLSTKEINIKVPQDTGAKSSLMEQLGEDDDDGDEESEEDGDYEGGGSDESGSGSDDDDDDDDDDDGSKDKEEEVKEKKPTKGKKRAAKEPKQTKEKKKRKKKDANAPKRASTGFMFFSNAIRSEVRKENPSLPITEVSKEIGARWRNLSAEEKEPYESSAKEDQLRYKKEMQAYKENKTSENADDSD